MKRWRKKKIAPICTFGEEDILTSPRPHLKLFYCELNNKRRHGARYRFYWTDTPVFDENGKKQYEALMYKETPKHSGHMELKKRTTSKKLKVVKEKVKNWVLMVRKKRYPRYRKRSKDED